MLKTKLESLLEAGFFELGVQFGERFYGEQVRKASAVDDVLNIVSVDEMKKQRPVSGEEHLLYAGFSFGELTKNQWHVYRNTVPFFKRTGVVIPYVVSYHAITLSERDEYEKIADALIPKLALEVVEIEVVDGMPIANIILGKNILVSYIDVNDEKRVMDFPPNVCDRLKHILPLHERPYDPEKVCDAVMSFLR